MAKLDLSNTTFSATQDNLQSCGSEGFIQWAIVHEVVVVHVHEDGQGLTQNDGDPHHYIAKLALHHGQRCQNSQWHLQQHRQLHLYPSTNKNACYN